MAYLIEGPDTDVGVTVPSIDCAIYIENYLQDLPPDKMVNLLSEMLGVPETFLCPDTASF